MRRDEERWVAQARTPTNATAPDHSRQPQSANDGPASRSPASRSRRREDAELREDREGVLPWPTAPFRAITRRSTTTSGRWRTRIRTRGGLPHPLTRVRLRQARVPPSALCRHPFGRGPSSALAAKIVVDIFFFQSSPRCKSVSHRTEGQRAPRLRETCPFSGVRTMYAH